MSWDIVVAGGGRFYPFLSLCFCCSDCSFSRAEFSFDVFFSDAGCLVSDARDLVSDAQDFVSDARGFNLVFSSTA